MFQEDEKERERTYISNLKRALEVGRLLLMSSTDVGKTGFATGLLSPRSEWQYLTAAVALGGTVGLALGIAVSNKRYRRQNRESTVRFDEPKVNGKDDTHSNNTSSSIVVRPDPREAKLLKNSEAEIKMVLCVRMVSLR